MAFGLPIVSSGVHGVPEIARAEREALLVPPGDSAALAAALARVLSDESLAGALGRAARERVQREFDAAVILPRHAALAEATARAPLQP
jgi:glycosyltransferase involved in cell wall biosynthesis